MTDTQPMVITVQTAEALTLGKILIDARKRYVPQVERFDIQSRREGGEWKTVFGFGSCWSLAQAQKYLGWMRTDTGLTYRILFRRTNPPNNAD